LLSGALYAAPKWRDFPPIAIVNHSARVNIKFDPESYISQADIEDFQVLVPLSIAQRMLRLSHPLRWAEPPDSLFERSDPVDVNGDGKVVRLLGTQAEEEWQRKATDSAAILYERVSWPVNENLSADSENLIRITNFNDGGAKAGPLNVLGYEYSLERCLRTNFGVAWESSGLDIDDGLYRGEITDLKSDFTELPGKSDLRLKQRNVVEMQAALWRVSAARADRRMETDLYCNAHDQQLFDDSMGGENADPAVLIGLIQKYAGHLEAEWPELTPFVLVTVSASKRLHFTLPENNPIELWQSLTWTAPAFLFMFINSAVCQTPHQLVQELIV
jgi:hypothetical protein